MSRLISPRPFAVDIILKTPDELRCDLVQRSFFAHEMVTKGKVLYERKR